jgi:hypothetical protein
MRIRNTDGVTLLLKLSGTTSINIKYNGIYRKSVRYKNAKKGTTNRFLPERVAFSEPKQLRSISWPAVGSHMPDSCSSRRATADPQLPPLVYHIITILPQPVWKRKNM